MREKEWKNKGVEMSFPLAPDPRGTYVGVRGREKFPSCPWCIWNKYLYISYSHNKWSHQHTKDLEVRHWCAWWLRICTIGELLEQVACWNCLTNTDLNKQQISERDIYRKQETKRTVMRLQKPSKLLWWTTCSYGPFLHTNLFIRYWRIRLITLSGK